MAAASMTREQNIELVGWWPLRCLKIETTRLSHTVKNGTLEETDELEKHVLLLGGKLVPSRVLASPLDLEGVKTGRDVGVEPLGGGVEVRKALGSALGPPESPPWGLLHLFALELLLALVLARIPVGVDVADKSVWKGTCYYMCCCLGVFVVLGRQKKLTLGTRPCRGSPGRLVRRRWRRAPARL